MIESLTQFAFLGIDLEQLIEFIGIIGVAIIIFAESGLLIGFFLPGDSLLFTAGFLVQIGLLHINIVVLILLLFAAAVFGDSVGYTFGRRIGRRLKERTNARLFKQEYLQQAEAFYEKYGGKAIILARFIPIVRTFAPIVAGTARMRYSTFLSYNVIGALLWTTLITLLGFFLGKWFTSMGLDIDQVILPVVTVIILISVLPPAIHVFKDKKRRRAILDGTKRQLKMIFGSHSK